MYTPLVSIIIPVYNAQKYVIECLESIRKQTYENYEVILINDGSTDDSPLVITEYIQKHSLDRFYLITQENGGVSCARNTGLRNAKGDWIAFVDSDDWIEPDYLLNMIKADAQYHADYYLSGFQAFEVEQQRFDVWSRYELIHGTIPKDLKSLSSFDYIWGRLYKKSILDEHRILFDERIKYCEDNAFNFDYIRVIRDYVCVHEIGYNYRRGHAGALSKRAITPQMRVHFVEHMRRFCDTFRPDEIIEGMKGNKSLTRILWNVISTDVIIDILDKQYLRTAEDARSAGKSHCGSL